MKKLKNVGCNFQFDPLSSFYHPEYMVIGNNVFIGEGAHISAEVTIGNNVMFGPRVTIIGGSHYYGIKGRSNRFLHPKGRENWEPITIEDEVWCGACIVIPKGVTLGMGCVVGAGSVITRSIPPFTIAVGNPCRPLKKIFPDAILKEHLFTLSFDESKAKQIIDRRREELVSLGFADLPVIDRTSEYWEFST